MRACNIASGRWVGCTAGNFRALAGLGLVYEFPHHIADALASGALVTVLDAWTPPFSGFYLYYPSRALMPPKLRVFVDFIKARALPQSPL
jgi:DNA-binding transcriptional LysR family regulator